MKYIVNGTKKSSEDDKSKPWYLLGIVSLEHAAWINLASTQGFENMFY